MCVQCHKKRLTVSDNTIQAEGPGFFLYILGKTSAEAIEKLATKVKKNLWSALEIGAKNGNVAVSKVTKVALAAISDVMNTYHKEKSFLGKFVWIH